MWCGPAAASALTGWSMDQVWLHIRALRETKGRRLTDVPLGGTGVTEISDAIRRAGYELVAVFENRRVRYADFRRQFRTGKYLCLQHRHLFAHIGSRPYKGAGRGIIVSAWRLERITSSPPSVSPQGEPQP